MSGVWFGSGAGAASVASVIKEFIATSGQVSFVLDQAPVDVLSLQLFVNGVEYDEGTNYSISGVTITWLNTPFSMDTGDRLAAYYN